jgi:hypothetical protein
MTATEQVEQQIRDVIANEALAIPLSAKLFSPTGLFSRLASTESERKALVGSPLFKEAQRRFRELQYQEAEAFGRAVGQVPLATGAEAYTINLEMAPSARERQPQG